MGLQNRQLGLQEQPETSIEIILTINLAGLEFFQGLLIELPVEKKDKVFLAGKLLVEPANSNTQPA